MFRALEPFFAAAICRFRAAFKAITLLGQSRCPERWLALFAHIGGQKLNPSEIHSILVRATVAAVPISHISNRAEARPVRMFGINAVLFCPGALGPLLKQGKRNMTCWKERVDRRFLIIRIIHVVRTTC